MAMPNGAETLADTHAQLGRVRIMDTLARGVSGPLDMNRNPPPPA